MSLVSDIDSLLSKLNTAMYSSLPSSLLESTLSVAAEKETLSEKVESDTIQIRMSEENTKHWGIWFDVSQVRVSEESSLQKIQVVDTLEFGKILCMDGKSQSSVKDEHIYHECLVHPCLLAYGLNNLADVPPVSDLIDDSSLTNLAKPKSVLILGAGELASFREVRRYWPLESDTKVEFTAVDIDEAVISLAKRELSEMHRNLYTDPRLTIHICSAASFVESALKERGPKSFDVIILDICDPIEAGPAIECYTREFYLNCFELLSDNGCLLTQSGKGGFTGLAECAPCICQTLRRVFGQSSVALFHSEIPSFGMKWAFCIALKNTIKERNEWVLSSLKYDSSLIDRIIREYGLNGDIARRVCGSELRHLDGTCMNEMFLWPKEQRRMIEEESRIISKDNLVFMY